MTPVSDLVARLGAIESKLADQRRLDAIDARIGLIDNNVCARLDAIEKRFDALDVGLLNSSDVADQEHDTIIGRLDAIERQMHERKMTEAYAQEQIARAMIRIDKIEDNSGGSISCVRAARCDARAVYQARRGCWMGHRTGGRPPAIGRDTAIG
jgi:hypothetical protein